MLKLDKEPNIARNVKTDTVSMVNRANTTNKPFYVIEVGSFKLTGADIGNLSALSLVLYLAANLVLTNILNSKLILSLSIILASLIYWLFISLLQLKITSKPKTNAKTNVKSN